MRCTFEFRALPVVNYDIEDAVYVYFHVFALSCITLVPYTIHMQCLFSSIHSMFMFSCHFVSIWLERGLVHGVSTKTCSFLAYHFVLQLVVLYLLVLSYIIYISLAY
jgi:hypothetical protein